MAAYTLTLSETETACGVTLDAVADLLPRGAFFGETFFLPANTPPALGTATARAAFAAPAKFALISKHTGFIGYRKSL